MGRRTAHHRRNGVADERDGASEELRVPGAISRTRSRVRLQHAKESTPVLNRPRVTTLRRVHPPILSLAQSGQGGKHVSSYAVSPERITACKHARMNGKHVRAPHGRQHDASNRKALDSFDGHCVDSTSWVTQASHPSQASHQRAWVTRVSSAIGSPE
eukprot:2491278-Pleurochrysis_carterae.AAC.2